MKKILAILLTAVMLLCLFAGCDSKPGPVEKPEPTETSAQTTAAPETTQTPETAAAPETTAAPELKVDHLETEVLMNDDEFCSAYLNVMACTADGNVLWGYTSPDCAQTELQSPCVVTETETLVIINEQGVIVDGAPSGHYLRAFDRQTGEELWCNEDFIGGSARACFDENGTLYICGYYGPDCCAIDKNGNTLWTVDQIDPSVWWPNVISYENGLISIYYDGSDSGTGEYRIIDQNGEQFIGGF